MNLMEKLIDSDLNAVYRAFKRFCSKCDNGNPNHFIWCCINNYKSSKKNKYELIVAYFSDFDLCKVKASENISYEDFCECITSYSAKTYRTAYAETARIIRESLDSYSHLKTGNILQVKIDDLCVVNTPRDTSF